MTRSRIRWAAVALAAVVLAGTLVAVLAPTATGPRRPPPPRAVVTVGDVTLHVDVADTREKRNRGLAGVTSLPEDGGMLFVTKRPSRMGIWMQGMLIPIDIVWIADGTVVHVVAGAEPDEPPHRTYVPPVLVDQVLEVAAGTAARVGLRVGTQVTVQRIS